MLDFFYNFPFILLVLVKDNNDENGCIFLKIINSKKPGSAVSVIIILLLLILLIEFLSKAEKVQQLYTLSK